MGAVVFLIFVAGIVGAAAWGAELEKRGVNAAWTQVGERLGLTFARDGLGAQRRLHGTLRECAVEVVEEPEGKGVRTRFVVGLRGIPLALSLKGEGAAAALTKLFQGEDVQTGDAAFDARVNVEGPEDTALAALGQAARAAVGSLVAREPTVKLHAGALVVEKKGRVREVLQLADLVNELVEVALSLRIGTVPDALAWNVRADRAASVRLRSLEILARDHAGSPALAQATEAALEDGDLRVRLAAARIAGGEREWDALSAMATRSDAGAEILVAVLQRLQETRPYEDVAPHVAELLRSHEPQVQRAAIAAAAAGRDRSAVERLCALARSPKPEVAAAVAKALGVVGDPRAEATLVRLLAYQSDEVGEAGVRTRAAAALGRVGTVAAVEPLLPLANAVLPGALRDAAREAVRSIQGRLGEADAGRLSVVGPVEGAAAGLSVVEQVREESAAALPLSGSKAPEKA